MEKITKNILLVEDNAIIAFDQKKQLGKRGYRVTHIINGEKAIEFITSNSLNIDLILMDIDLGKGIDGTETAKEILKLKEIPVVFLSSHIEPDVVKKTETITSYGYVVKNSGITVLDASIKMAFKLFYAHKNILKHKSDSDTANKQLHSTIKQLEETNETLNRLNSAIVNTKEVILITDKKGIITYINPQFTKLYEYTEEEIVGKVNPRILHAEHVTDEINDEFWKNIMIDPHLNIQFLNRTKSGKLLSIEASIDPIYDSRGEIKEFVQIHRDITSKLQADDNILRSNDYLEFLSSIALEQANARTLDDLSGLIISQLKNITNAIFVSFSEYDSVQKLLKNMKISASQTMLNAGIKIVGKKIFNTEVPVNKDFFHTIISSRIMTFSSLYEDTNGAINKKTSEALAKALKIDKIWGLSYAINNILFGTSAFALKKGQKAPDKTVLNSFINITSISIKRLISEKELKKRADNLKNINDINVMLSTSENKIHTMQMMLDNYEEAIWTVDKDFKYTFVNSYYAMDYKKAFGIEPKEGMYNFEILGPELIEFWKPKYELALLGERISFEYEENALREKHYFRVNLNPIHSNGKITGVSAISVDISKQKIAELKAQNEMIKSQQYLDIAGVMFVAIDKESNITLVNKKLCDSTGYAKEELIGKHWFKMMIPDRLQEEIIPVSKKLLSGEIEPVEYFENSILTKDGREIIIAWHNTILKDENGHITGHLSSGDDITSRIKYEKDIKNLLEEKELILKEVHHRIKNNMTTLIGLITLQTNTAIGKETENALLEIENKIRSMMVLYETLYQSSDFQHVSTKQYLSSLIDNIIENFTNLIKISVNKNISDIQIDAKKIFNLGIIINELITNTMKYAFNGRSSGKIDFSVIPKNQYIVITVADNGIGLPSDIDVNNNPGFGMKLIKMLVDQMEGSIQIERGNGTKFIISCKLNCI